MSALDAIADVNSFVRSFVPDCFAEQVLRGWLVCIVK
jgi:hypothetical protein